MSNCEEKNDCGGRREFLVKASALAGGLVLSLSGANASVAQDKKDKNDKNDASVKTSDAANDVTLKLGEGSPLAKVGGYETVETKSGKVVVVRLTETEFKAFSAVCPHKGGPIKYDEASKQLFCPWHNSRFDTSGKVVKGPAKTDLQNYKTEEAVVVSIA